MTDKLDINIDDAPNENYKKFFLKFNEIETLDVSKWNATHLIGLFCKLYKNYYNTDYKFKYNTTAPSKCFEVFQIKKLGQNLSSNPVICKKYIEWAFQEKAKTAKRRITSIAFLSHESLVSEYKLKYLAGDLKDQKIERTTILPQEYLDIIKKYNCEINNYGELSFLIQINEEWINQMTEELSVAGINIEMIRRII